MSYRPTAPPTAAARSASGCHRRRRRTKKTPAITPRGMMTAVDPSDVMTLRKLVSNPALWAPIHAVTRGSWAAIPSWPTTSWVTAPNARAASAPAEAVNVSLNPRGVLGARPRLPPATCGETGAAPMRAAGRRVRAFRRGACGWFSHSCAPMAVAGLSVPLPVLSSSAILPLRMVSTEPVGKKKKKKKKRSAKPSASGRTRHGARPGQAAVPPGQGAGSWRPVGDLAR